MYFDVLMLSIAGDEDEIQDLEDRASAFNHRDYWDLSHSRSMAVIAASDLSSRHDGLNKNGHKVKATLIEEPVPIRHSHDGRQECRQPTESVAEFLARLPPSTTTLEDVGPWIFIANRHEHDKTTKANIAKLKSQSAELLDEFEKTLESLQFEQKQQKQTKTVMTRKINAERRKLESNIADLAQATQTTTGKWMLFPSIEDLDGTWTAIAEATAQGILGIGAKVATDTESGKNRLIAVYTKDFSDKEDIKRVLLQLIDQGVVSKPRGRGQAIYYKCDAYTYLDILNGNRWGIKPSMYSSTDILARK